MQCTRICYCSLDFYACSHDRLSSRLSSLDPMASVSACVYNMLGKEGWAKESELNMGVTHLTCFTKKLSSVLSRSFSIDAPPSPHAFNTIFDKVTKPLMWSQTMPGLGPPKFCFGGNPEKGGYLLWHESAAARDTQTLTDCEAMFFSFSWCAQWRRQLGTVDPGTLSHWSPHSPPSE